VVAFQEWDLLSLEVSQRERYTMAVEICKWRLLPSYYPGALQVETLEHRPSSAAPAPSTLSSLAPAKYGCRAFKEARGVGLSPTKRAPR
jgi:hypothetical protein